MLGLGAVALSALSGAHAFVPGSMGIGAATSLQMSARHGHSSSSAMTRRGAVTLGSFAALGLGFAAPAEAKRAGDVKNLFSDEGDGSETKEEKIERKKRVGIPHKKNIGRTHCCPNNPFFSTRLSFRWLVP